MNKIILLFFFVLFFNQVYSQSQSLPYVSGWDSPSEQAGWVQYHTGDASIYQWGLGGGSSAFTPPNSLNHDYNVGAPSTDTLIDWYVSPPINCSGVAVLVRLKVSTSGFSTPFVDNCEIWYSVGDPDPSNGNFYLLGNLSYMTPQYTWLDTLFNPPVSADSIYFAFKYKTIGASWSAYSIDNFSVEQTLSIDDNNSNSHSQIFPNPFNENTSLFIDEKFSGSNYVIRICDLAGRTVKKFYSESRTQIPISGDDIAAGTYLLNISNNGSIIENKKLIKE